MNTITPEDISPSDYQESLSLSQSLFSIEKDLETRFLGDDIQQICEAAADSRFPVLISTAGLSLKKRQEAFQVWRRERIKEAVENSRFARAFLDHAEASVVSSIFAGEISLAKFQELVGVYTLEVRRKEAEERRAHKSGLRLALRKLIADVEDKHQENIEPRWIVFTPQGETTYWRYERRAKEYGYETGGPFFLLALDPGRSQIKPPRHGWTGKEGQPVEADPPEAA